MNRKLKKYKKILNRNRNRRKKLDKFLKLYKLYPILFIFVTLFIVIAAISAIVLAVANWEWFELKSKNELGDAFGGLANPIVAFIGVIVTFLAFYIQYTFNREQSKLIAQQRYERIKEREERDKELAKEYFDKKFFELLNIHNQNVNNITIKNNTETVSGRRAFDNLVDELHFIILLLASKYQEIPLKVIINKSYSYFFFGVKDYLRPSYDEEVNQLNILRNLSEKNYDNFFTYFKKLKLDYRKIRYPKLNFFVLQGHSSELSLYYRFLFMMVKNVVSQKDEILSYSEKREYLKILRTQLSNSEQILLYYNWYADFGEKWEDESNKYFTDYRMIHNIHSDKMYPDLEWKKTVSDLAENMKILHDKDYLFEEDEWFDLEI